MSGPQVPGGQTDPDGLERLWTPYRMSYVRGEDPDPGCPFCRIGAPDGDDELLIVRGQSVYAVLNRFPYNPGHLMVIPYRHIGDITEMTREETHEMAEMTQKAVSVIRSVSAPAAFNIGLNLGSVAGGSLSDHIHQHVVPRWTGDANFMTVTAGVKVLPQLLADTRALLADAWGN